MRVSSPRTLAYIDLTVPLNIQSSRDRYIFPDHTFETKTWGFIWIHGVSHMSRQTVQWYPSKATSSVMCMYQRLVEYKWDPHWYVFVPNIFSQATIDMQKARAWSESTRHGFVDVKILKSTVSVIVFRQPLNVDRCRMVAPWSEHY